MAGYSTKGAPPTNGSVYVSNLPPGTDENMLAEYFGTIGLLKRDKRTGTPKVWLYRDKETDEPKGDATVTYEDPHAALAAVEWFNNKDFHGSIIGVFMAESKNSKSGGDHPSESFGFDGGAANKEIDGGAGRGRGQGDSSAKPWQQDGDWMCPNTSCTNVNFAFRGVCNRCGTARPAGASGGSMGGGGRGRGRGGGADGGPPGKGASTVESLHSDERMERCGNVNWAKRLKCNVCNTNKPGQNEGGVREFLFFFRDGLIDNCKIEHSILFCNLTECFLCHCVQYEKAAAASKCFLGGRGGGYKELDEQELEETKRRRREAEQDDGEMYDEFGNLKKKYRVKTHQADARPAVAAGRAGWDVEELGVDRDGRERSRDRQRDRGDKHRDHHHYDKHRRRSRSGSLERERGKERDYDRDRDRDRDYGRGSSDG
ncbi:hypothetical protein YC2023_043679 [Brassica napus]